MALLRRTAALILALLLVLLSVPYQAAVAETDGMVRVRLTRLGTPESLSFTVGCDYYVNGDLNARIAAGSSVTLKVSGESIILNCNGYTLDMGDDFTVRRKSTGATGVKFTSPSLGNVFCGDLRFINSSGRISAILHIYVEDYLYGVVGYEMSNSYPIEALKAQAIAARNYVLRAKLSRTSQAYDVTDTTSDQIFRGYNSGYKNVIKAVDATHGMVLGYGGKLAACYYGASNGGQTESTQNAWGTALAYSVVKEDKYDLESAGKCNSATLKKDQTEAGMNAALRAALLAGMEESLVKYGCSTDPDVVLIEEIVDIEPHSPKYTEPSALYTKLRFTVKVSSVDSGGERISGNVAVDVPTYGGFEDWFSLGLNSAANETISVEETETAFKISFRRWGHGVGMSQHGARVMARDYAMSYRDILSFYYPGAELHSISLSDTTGSGLKNGGNGATIVLPTSTPEPAVTPEPALASEPAAASISKSRQAIRAQVRLNNVSGRLNVRKMATTASGIVTKLNHGDVVEVYALEGDWASIGINGVYGYVMKKYLAALDAAPEPEPTPAGTDAVYAQVKLSGASSRLNLRSEPSTASAVLAKLKNGDLLKVTSLQGNWAGVVTENQVSGYAHKAYLIKADAAAITQPAPSPTPAPEPEASIKAEATDYTFVYSAADDGARPVAGMNIGDTVTVTAVSGGWAKVTFGRYQGYVPVEHLKKAD